MNIRSKRFEFRATKFHRHRPKHHTDTIQGVRIQQHKVHHKEEQVNYELLDVELFLPGVFVLGQVQLYMESQQKI